MTQQHIDRIHYTRLVPNPLNIRKDIARDAAFLDIAASIKEHGVIQPLVGIPVPDGVLLVCGHVRRACLQYLVDEGQLPADHPHCSPPILLEPGMPVERQLALMAIENLHRIPVDPVHEGLFYASLLAQRWSKARISSRLRVSGARINNRLAIAASSPRMQAWFSDGQLPLLAAEPLAAIPNDEDREKLAQLLAGRNLKLDRIHALCERVATHGLEGKAPDKPARPSDRSNLRVEARPPGRRIGLAALQAAALETCEACDVAQPLRLPESVTGQAANEAAGAVCAGCSVRDLTNACEMCPLVEFLKHLEATHG
jgi:ParB family chromosome partitioning protein